MRLVRAIATASAALLGAGCLTYRHDGRLFVSSEPPGAAILVGGRDVGFSTPTWVDLRRVSSPTVTLRKEGYRDESFSVDSRIRYEGMTIDASRATRFLWVPFFVPLTSRDLLFPWRFSTIRAPSRVHLRLLPR